MDIKITLPAPHPRLKARQTRRSKTIPGTAVTLDGSLYEIVEHRVEEERHIYNLAPWPEGQKIRHHITWDNDQEERFLNSVTPEKRSEPLIPLLIPTQILVGFLPASTQRRISSRFAFDPARATLYSAILQIFFTSLFFFYESALRITGARLLPSWAWIVLGYLFVEGFVRVGSGGLLHTPVGTLPLAFLRQPGKREKRHDPFTDLLTLNNGVLLLFTHYPKPRLDEGLQVIYNGKAYTPKEKKYVHFTTIYTLEESEPREDAVPLDLSEERSRNRLAHVSYVYAPLWGFLPASRQKFLGNYGLYNPNKFTLFSLLCILVISVPTMIFDLAQIAIKGPSWLSYVRLPLALYFTQESILRLIRLVKEKEPSGTLLGGLVLPIAHLLLKKERS